MHLLHDAGAMVFDGPAADAKIGGDVLAGMTREDEIENLPLPGRETQKIAGRVRVPGRRRLAVSLERFMEQDAGGLESRRSQAITALSIAAAVRAPPATSKPLLRLGLAVSTKFTFETSTRVFYRATLAQASA